MIDQNGNGNMRRGTTEWTREQIVTIDANPNIGAEITSRPSRDGKYLSIKFGRFGERDGETFVFPFVREEDLEDIVELTKKTQAALSQLPR